MENRLVFTLGELVRDIDILAKFKKVFGFDEYQQSLIDLKKLTEEQGLETNEDSKIFMSTDQTAMLITNYKRLVGNPNDYVGFSLQTLKRVFDILAVDKEEKDNTIVFVSLKKEKPCIVVNSHSAIMVAPRRIEELPQNPAETEEAETQETQTETETQEAEKEPVPATA